MEIINTIVKHPVQGSPPPAHADTQNQNVHARTHAYHISFPANIFI